MPNQEEILEAESRVVFRIPESTKIWLADYSRRHRTTMSELLRALVVNLKKQSTEPVEAKQE